MNFGEPLIEIDRLYNVVVDPETWPDVLHGLARSMGAVGACLAADQGSKTLIARPVSPDIVGPIDDFINSGWYQRDLRGHRSWPLFRHGRQILVEHDISTEHERRMSDYHNGWLRPWDLPWWGSAGFSYDDQYYGLVMLRNSQQGALTHEEMEPLRLLRPHLSRVLNLVDLLSMQRAEAILDTMELIDRAAFLLNGRGRVMRFNAKAEALMPAELIPSHGHLRAAYPENDNALQRLIANVIALSAGEPLSEDGVVPLRRIGRKPLLVTALPVIGGLSDILTGARAILTVNDLEAKQLLPEQKLRQVFRLTGAEARVAARIGQGQELDEISDELVISIGTTRAHLKAVFSKTGTHRQSQLALLVQRASGI